MPSQLIAHHSIEKLMSLIARYLYQHFHLEKQQYLKNLGDLPKNFEDFLFFQSEIWFHGDDPNLAPNLPPSEGRVRLVAELRSADSG